MAQSPAEINDWMTAISNTLPPPPHLPLEDKRLSLTPLQLQQDQLKSNRNHRMQNGCAVPVRNGNCVRQTPSNVTANNVPSTTNTSSYANKNNSNHNNAFENDHTVLSGVVIDWGHGWGWGQAAWAAQTACAHEAAISSALYCQAAEDYTLGGYDELDWSAFGDFSF